MSDAGKIRVTFECDDHAEMVAWTKAFLEEEGYTVEKKVLHAKETPTQFCERVGLSPNSFRRTLRHPACPKDYEARFGARGSIVWIRATPALDEFIRENQARCGRNSNHHAQKK